jgi:uncharacterized protein
VDIFVERCTTAVVGIEAKAVASVAPADSRGLRMLKEAVGARFAAGAVFHDGEAPADFGDHLFALLVWSL